MLLNVSVDSHNKCNKVFQSHLMVELSLYNTFPFLCVWLNYYLYFSKLKNSRNDYLVGSRKTTMVCNYEEIILVDICFLKSEYSEFHQIFSIECS